MHACTVTGVFLYSHWCESVHSIHIGVYVYGLIQTSNPSLFDTKLWNTLEEEADEVPLSSKNTPVWSGREKDKYERKDKCPLCYAMHSC